MRILLYTGKGGVGKTTTASATAVRLAECGVKTLVLSTDSAHSLLDAFGLSDAHAHADAHADAHAHAPRVTVDEPVEVLPGLSVVQVDTQRRFEASWSGVQAYLRALLDHDDLDPVLAEELTVLPGIEEVLALLAVREYAASGRWDVIVLDCAPTAETLRLLALPEALNWYLERVVPLHRLLGRSLKPVSALLGRSGVLPSPEVVTALLSLTCDLAATRALLGDPDITRVRLVLTPEAVVTAEARRTFTALSLYGYRVDEVVVNRVFPAPTGHASAWQRSWVKAQHAQLGAIDDAFAGLVQRRVTYQPEEPVGIEALSAVATALYGAPGTPATPNPAEFSPAPALMSVTATQDGEFTLELGLGLTERGDVDATRSGDDLVVTVAGRRRVLSLPSVLRRCEVVGGAVQGGRLLLRFAPDPDLWPGV